MLNQIVIVGRLQNYDLVMNSATIAVPRQYKNENGEYDTDLIKVNMDKNMSKNMSYLTIGDLIGIKGRIEVNGMTLEIKVDRVTFLSNNKGEQNNED
jgi:single-stranded DNA-binding protein